MNRTAVFEVERPRLVGIATRVLGDHAEAEDVVQQAWLRLHRQGSDPDSLPAWLTTVTTRLCLDRLRSRAPVPTAEIEPAEVAPDVAEEVALADTVGIACRQLGGPCEFAHRGESADEVIKSQDRHLKEAEKAGDASHQTAREAMKGRWRHPKKSMSWYSEMKRAFADLPEA